MLIQTIKQLLLKVIDDIDAGNSNITEDDAMAIVECLHKYTRKDECLSKYEACKYLNLARSTFDKYVALNKIPKGNKRIGFKELYWTKAELDECIKHFHNK